MHKAISQLRGFSHLMNVDARKVTTPELFNSHIDSICEAVQGLKIQAATEVEVTTEETREEPKRGKDRMRRGNRTRRKARGEDEPDPDAPASTERLAEPDEAD